jgi:penicillin-binding protein 2
MESLAIAQKDSWLSWFLRGVLIIGMLFLLARLVELQVVKGSYYRSLSEGNRIRRVPITAPRGKVFARGGEILVDNKKVEKRVIFNSASGFTKTEDLSGISSEEIITEWKRDYLFGDKLAHVSGYLGEVNEEELGKINPDCPDKGPRKMGALVGRAGLEQEYECTLSGVDGEELVEVDTQGRKIRILGKKEPIAGIDIKTSIDIGLQKVVADSLGDKKGAAIITDSQGGILALYSSPSFDPNVFIDSGKTAQINKILNDKDLPLFNRAIGGQYHPGSVFKPIVVIAALAEGKINKDFIFDDPGVITIKNFSYANWYFTQYGRTEGKINVTRALARSTDTFFYKVGEMVGAETIGTYAENFRMGEKSGIDLPGEITGLIPNPTWKLKEKGEPWFLGNTYHMAIGQGDLSITPIEEHTAILAIANKGNICTPGIVQKPICQKLKINSDYLDIVKDGMVAACSTGGTGLSFFDFDPKVACKTGTAETNLDGKTHAWFTVWAPYEFPEIVTTVIVEGGGEGSKIAGPIAREILDYWFHKKI